MVAEPHATSALLAVMTNVFCHAITICNKQCCMAYSWLEGMLRWQYAIKIGHAILCCMMAPPSMTHQGSMTFSNKRFHLWTMFGENVIMVKTIPLLNTSVLLCFFPAFLLECFQPRSPWTLCMIKSWRQTAAKVSSLYSFME